MKTLGYLFSAFLLLSAFSLFTGCSASTSPISTPATSNVDTSIQLRSLNWPGDTVWVTSSETNPLISILATVAGVPTDGVNVVYLEPLRRVNNISSTYDSGIAYVNLPVSAYLPHRDTSFVMEFRGLYDGKSSPVMRKIIECNFGTEKPSPLELRSVDQASIAIRWTRTAGDRYTDTLFTVDSNGVSQSYLVSPDRSEVTLTGLNLGMPYTIVLHTRGGTTTPVPWAPIIRTGVLRIHSMATANGSEAIGVSLRAAGVRTVTPSEFDSADIVLGVLPPNRGYKPGTALIAGSTIPLVFPTYAGRPEQLNFSRLKPLTIGQEYFRTDSVGYLYATVYGPVIFVDTIASKPMTAFGYQSSDYIHLLMVQVDPQPNGALVGKDSEGDFIDLEIAFQPGRIQALRTQQKRDHN